MDEINYTTTYLGWPSFAGKGLPNPIVANKGLPYPTTASKGLPYHTSAGKGLPYPTIANKGLAYPAVANKGLAYPAVANTQLPFAVDSTPWTPQSHLRPNHADNQRSRLPSQPLINTPSTARTAQELPDPFPVNATTEPAMPTEAAIPAASAQPATTARKTKTGRGKQAARSKSKKASEWEGHKQTMADLYMKQKKPLDKLRELMRENFAFEASPKQYKTQFAAWGWSKNFTRDLARYMNDKHNRRLRQGKASTQFVWRGQVWPVEAAQKLLTDAELEKSQNEALTMPTPKTPFDMSVETPLPTTSAEINDLPEREPQPTTPAADQVHAVRGTSARPIRLRYKGYTIQDIAKIHHAALELEKNESYEHAKDKFCELLDVSKHLFSGRTEAYRSLNYEAACFFARNEDMEMADRTLDNLSEECIQRWGTTHEQTLHHYATVGKLLSQWDRHGDAVNLFKRVVEDLPALVASAQNTPSQGLNMEPSAFRSYIDVDGQPLQHSINAVTEEHAEERSSFTLAMLQEQLQLDRILDADGERSSDEAILQLLDTMVENPTENAANILRARCLLVKFYNKADMPDKGVAALSTAKDVALSLLKQNTKFTTAFFHISIHLAKTLFDAEQQAEAEEFLDRLQEKFTDDYGHDHTDTISFLIRIGKVFQRQKRWDLAQPRFQAAFAGVVDRFGAHTALAKRLEMSLEDRYYPFEANSDDDSTFMPIVML